MEETAPVEGLSGSVSEEIVLFSPISETRKHAEIGHGHGVPKRVGRCQLAVQSSLSRTLPPGGWPQGLEAV